MAGLVPAIHVFDVVTKKRGCPRQARAWRFNLISFRSRRIFGVLFPDLLSTLAISSLLRAIAADCHAAPPARRPSGAIDEEKRTGRPLACFQIGEVLGADEVRQGSRYREEQRFGCAPAPLGAQGEPRHSCSVASVAMLAITESIPHNDLAIHAFVHNRRAGIDLGKSSRRSNLHIAWL